MEVGKEKVEGGEGREKVEVGKEREGRGKVETSLNYY